MRTAPVAGAAVTSTRPCIARRFLVFPEDANVPHLRSALFVLGAGASSDRQHSTGDAQAPAAVPFSFAAAEVRHDAAPLYGQDLRLTLS